MLVAFFEGMSSKVKHLFCGFYIKAETTCDGYYCPQGRIGSDVLFSLTKYFFSKTCKVAEMRFAYTLKLDYFVNILPACFADS